MRRSIPIAAVLLAAGALGGCAFSFNNPRFRADTTLTQTADHIPGTGLVVDTTNGRIEVVAEPDRADVAIEVRIRCKGETQAEADERLAATTVSITRDAQQRLVIKPVFPEKRYGGDSASFEIRIPEVRDARLDTSNGSVVTRDLTGKLEIDTSNGSIQVLGHDGSAHVDTSNGRITVENLTGSLYADTSNGAMRLVNVHGPVDADTSNGSITVQVDAGFNGTVTFDTSNGSITIDDQHGRITSTSVRRNHGTITVGEGGATSRFDTSNGRISFTIKG